MRSRKLIASSIALTLTMTAAVGAGKAASANDPFDLDLWEVDAAEYRVESFRGREALLLDRGSAILIDGDFKNGVI